MQNCCFPTFETQNAPKKLVAKVILDCWNKSKTKNLIEKFIVDSLRLLHEKILYFEIGSKQVANNGNNFCNKQKS